MRSDDMMLILGDLERCQSLLAGREVTIFSKERGHEMTKHLSYVCEKAMSSSSPVQPLTMARSCISISAIQLILTTESSNEVVQPPHLGMSKGSWCLQNTRFVRALSINVCS